MKNFFYTLLFFCITQPIWATNFTVSNLNDANAGSLRQAILDANADGSATAGSPHIITFSLAGTINTSSAMPTITNHITIIGDVSGNTIFRANANPSYRLLHINGALTVQFDNLIIQGGNPGGPNAGGGILNAGGTLTLNNCVLDGNVTGAAAGAHGGGINQTTGVLVVNNSTFKNNDSGTFGQGGAINMNAGTATLTNCTVHNNAAGLNAGGIYAATTSTLTLINCTVTNNSTLSNNAGFATGGVYYHQGVLNMTNTILANNTSVAIPNSDLNSLALSYTGVDNQNIVEACNGFNAGFCISASFFSSADPNLSAVSQCGIQDVFRPNTGSVAINNGTATGAPATDICGNAWIGSHDIGSVESVNPGTALDFDGTDDYVDIMNPFTGYTNEVTVEAWINIQSITAAGPGIGQGLPGIDNLATNVWLLHLNADNTISFYVNDAGTPRIAKSTGAVIGTGWHHVVGVASATETAIYVDGVKQAVSAGISTNIQNVASANLQIGKDLRYNAGRFFDGQIDEVRVWSEALCSAKIIARKDCELVGNEDNLQHYYNFNQGAASGSNTTETTLLDRQTNTAAQNGNLTNFGLSAGSSNWVNGSVNGVTGSCSSAFPEINLIGNSVSVTNNDVTPSLADHTDFGAVDPTSGSIVRTFTIDNTAGTGALTVNSIFNTNTGDFTIGGISFPATVALGATTTFTVTFDPSTVGSKTATLIVQNDDCDEGNYIFSIQGLSVVLENIALTEWISSPSGTATQEQWVEIHNYGATPVDLQNWRLKDEDSDDDIITASSYIIPAGGYVILANNKANFESLWFNGCVKTEILEVTGLTLDNSTDEIILENSSGTVIWSVAYNNDATTGRATHYTESPLFTNRTWGSKATPGVNRSGNDVTATLGYEKNNSTVDPNSMTASNNDIGSPLNGTISPPEQNRGTVLDFDGMNDYVNLGSNLENLGAHSMEAWIYVRSDAGFGEIISQRYVSGLAYNHTTNKLHNVYGDGTSWTGSIESNSTIPYDQWTHVASSRDAAGNVTIYINGIEEGTLVNNSIGANTEDRAIGASCGGACQYFNGQIDEARMWNTARTATEIRENMHLTLMGCETGLLGYWQMNDGTGASTLTDKSNNSNNGTLTTMDPATDWVTGGVNVGNDAGGNSNSQTITVPAGTGPQTFASANAEIYFLAHSITEDITVTYQEFAPNNIAGADGVSIIQNPVWTINQSTNTGTSLGNYTFTFPAATFTNTDPTKYSLYYRPMYSDGNWTKIAAATAITTTSAKFTKISLTGQFMVVQESENEISDVRGNMYNISENFERIFCPGINLSNTSFTVELWAKRNSTTTEDHFFGQGTVGTRTGLHARYNTNGSISFAFFNDDLISAPNQPSAIDGQWHHLAFVYNSTTRQREIFVDGISIATDVAVGHFNGAAGMNIGAQIPPGVGANNSMDGSIDEFRVWNNIRTEAQIRENMHLTLKGNETNLVSYYQFNNDDPVNTTGGVKDGVSGNNGTTQNIAATAYVPSEVAVAGGTSDRVTIGGAGNYSFPNTGINVEFGATTPNGEIIISRLETERPHGWNSLSGDVDNEYFIVHNYGTNQTFSPLVDITFNRMNYINPADAGVAQASSPLQLYKRKSNDFGATWGTTLGGADNVTAGSNGSIGYNASNGITSFSQIVVLNAGPNSDLPVEFLNFDAQRINQGQVQLDWATGSEKNNQGFEIERMLEHETSFTKVGWVDGQGTTPSTTHYQYVEDNGYQGISYYRLRQIDTDGSFEFSTIKAVNGAGNQDGIVNIDVYPNPIEDRLTIHFDLLPKDVKVAKVQIMDARGQLVYQSITAIQSYQNLTLSAMEDWASAIYMLSIELDNGEQITRKFVKK